MYDERAKTFLRSTRLPHERQLEQPQPVHLNPIDLFFQNFVLEQVAVACLHHHERLAFTLRDELHRRHWVFLPRPLP